jgi:2-amino-4-hydroxy-6-hydroxymethyldihydropteridine diphosphokinase
MGRIRTVKNAPRTIDIDILFFNNEIINRSDLIVPHPEIQNRRFVLIPINEIAPQMIHPVLNKTIEQLLLQCPDQLAVKKI